MARGDSVVIYLTKYALSQGISKLTAVDVGDGMMRTPNHFFYSRSDYCFTREEAIAKADAMRKKRIISLKAQIAKLEKMVFDDVEAE